MVRLTDLIHSQAKISTATVKAVHIHSKATDEQNANELNTFCFSFRKHQIDLNIQNQETKLENICNLSLSGYFAVPKQ